LSLLKARARKRRFKTGLRKETTKQSNKQIIGKNSNKRKQRGEGRTRREKESSCVAVLNRTKEISTVR
jgi:hypothetical protein